jgi:hypothetical protein
VRPEGPVIQRQERRIGQIHRFGVLRQLPPFPSTSAGIDTVAGRDVKLAGIDFRLGNKFGLAYTPNRLVIFALMLGASTDPRRNHAHVTNREVLVT